MQIRLGSGGFRTAERRARLTAAMRALFGDVERVLFVPYALADHDGYVRALEEKGLAAGYRLDGIHRHDDPVRAIEEAPALYVGGGNTFRLASELRCRGLFDVIRRRVAEGVPYLGVSAGSNVACPTLMTTNDMPIVDPHGLEALGLVRFQINPHYHPGGIWFRTGDEWNEHFGETRDDRIREFHELYDTPVVGLWEGAILTIEAESKVVRLDGAPARLFRRGREPVDFLPGAQLPLAP